MNPELLSIFLLVIFLQSLTISYLVMDMRIIARRERLVRNAESKQRGETVTQFEARLDQEGVVR